MTTRTIIIVSLLCLQAFSAQKIARKLRCDLKPVVGLCRGAFPKWYFNPPTQTCETFTFGGCDSEAARVSGVNRFDSREHCTQACLGLAGREEPTQAAAVRSFSDCDLTVSVGDACAVAAGTVKRYYFDKASKQCLPFGYSGCGGNANNFRTMEECLEARKICSLPRTDCPKPTFSCAKDPCFGVSCPAFPGAICKPDRCQGCGTRPRFFVLDQEVSSLCGSTVPTLESSTDCVACKTDPCSTATCAEFPRASCDSDCKGCRAKFFFRGREVTSHCTTSSQPAPAVPRPLPSGCPGGKSIANCFANPCLKKCAAHPDAICESDYCGGCNARFYDRVSRQEVTNSCDVSEKSIDLEPAAPASNVGVQPTTPARNVDLEPATPAKVPFCPDGKPRVSCFANPCLKKCAAHPDAICESDYCGGCNARFYDRVSRREVTNSCDDTKKDEFGRLATAAAESLCPDGKSIFNCLMNPCGIAKCAAHPEAICESDYCGGCIARFYDRVRRQEVTNSCDQTS